LIIKTLYLVRHAKSDWSVRTQRDFERGLKKSGLSDLKTISSYLKLRQTKVDLILSSASLRTQLTADAFAQALSYTDTIQYMEELYLTPPEMIINVLSLQEDVYDSILLVGHNPALTELANILQDDAAMSKFPTLGVLSIHLDIDTWDEVKYKCHGETNFFISPKQFKYYMPKQIQTTLEI